MSVKNLEICLTFMKEKGYKSGLRERGHIDGMLDNDDQNIFFIVFKNDFTSLNRFSF